MVLDVMHHRHHVPSFSRFGIKSQEAPLVLYVSKGNPGSHYYTQRLFFLSLSLRRDESSVGLQDKLLSMSQHTETKFTS